MKASIIIPTFDKIAHLEQVLQSIDRQRPPFQYETIVVNDGPNHATNELAHRYFCRLAETGNRSPRNPAAAYNVGFRMARGEVLIITKDDVVQKTGDAINQLVRLLDKGRYLIATVRQRDRDYCSPERPRPLMFLGSVLRKHIYAVGGCEEQLGSNMGFDDNYLAACLNGQGLLPEFTDHVVGEHIPHPHPANLESEQYKGAEAVVKRRAAECKAAGTPLLASGGPWEWKE